jgi:hypothetical protein
MQPNFSLGFPIAATAALLIALTAGCAEVPTSVGSAGELGVAPVVALYSIGDTGEGGMVDAVTPSTNEGNKTQGWAHVIWNSDVAGPGEAPLKFIQPRSFFACFEYRSDGAPPPDDTPNYNTAIEDGLWDFECLNNQELEITLVAEEYVEVRMVFGAESDERFDWTRFDVLNKESCKNGGWQSLGFRNQGQCVRWVQTGKDSRGEEEGGAP